MEQLGVAASQISLRDRAELSLSGNDNQCGDDGKAMIVELMT